MKGVIITHPGMEAVSGKEVKELIGADCKVAPSVVLFDSKKLEDFLTLSYCSQSAIKVVYLLFSSSIKKLDDVLLKIKDLDLSEWLKGKSFVVRSKVIDNAAVDTMESEREIGNVIYEKYNKSIGTTVNLDKPDITFFTYVFKDAFYFGVDFAGFDTSKRNYRIFCQSDSIKGTVAYGLVRISGYDGKQSLLDPFCQSGTVAIEAAFFASKKPINFYSKDKFAFLKFPQFEKFDFDKFFAKLDKPSEPSLSITCSDSQQRNVKAAEKNAKIAGLNKLVRFSRLDVEWLDTKFEKNSVDLIVSNPPKVSRLLTEKGLDKIFQEFFYTADFILKPKGKIVILVKSYAQILNQAQRYNFALRSKFPVHQGKEEFNILIFEKEKK
jgi:putative N6-adenine-specific DNA methylase